MDPTCHTNFLIFFPASSIHPAAMASPQDHRRPSQRPALLRPGRMDMHIYMGYCTPDSFRILAKNYHLIDYHAMYPEIEKLIEEVMVTPAEVAEVLMRNDDADVALHDLVDVLKSKLNDASVKTEHVSANNQEDDGDDV